MILLDPNVIIAFWRKPARAVADVMRSQEVCVCGPVLSELMHGARREEELEEIQALVAGLPQVEVNAEVCPELGRNLYALRKAGLTVPFRDALLATLAIVHGLEVWTYDSHFVRMQRAMTRLRLFSLGSAGPRERGNASR